MSLTKEDALYCATIFQNYFDSFSKIDDYMRSQKMLQMAELPATLPGCGLEYDLFDDYSISPNDMEFDLTIAPHTQWTEYIKLISSHRVADSIPGRNMRFYVTEKNTGKMIGFISLGSPVINCKPRNDLIGQIFTQTKEATKAFNDTTIMGFTIVPTQPFGYNYLGGKLLAAICCSHEIREILNKKYNMNLCLFETTSLYGTSKSVSQYDGMKPYIRFKGVTDSNFVPSLDGETYKIIKDFIEEKTGKDIVNPFGSSKKLKATMKAISLIKVGLKGTPELTTFNESIEKAKSLTERKRYYVSNYGFKNYIDVVAGKTDILVPDPENFDKFYMKNIVQWWKQKATNRYENLKAEGRLRTELEVWTSGKDIQIIR
jgi:hypothetical protein